MAAPTLKGPGLLYVNSKIVQTDLLSEESYIKWYGEDHIPEIIQTSGINSALRWKNVDPNADKPFLALYPMNDIAFLQSEEFGKISVHSELLPNGGPIYDFAEFDIRYYELVQVYDPRGTSPGQVKLISMGAFELPESITEQEFNNWYKEEHLESLSKVPGYLRTTRHKLVYHRSNAQSRSYKGLAPQAEDKKSQSPPTYLAIHEFETVNLDIKALMATGETEWSKKILGSVTNMETSMFKIAENFGNGEFFHEK